MAAPQPSSKNIANIKAKLLRPATTSHFQVWFNPPEPVRNFAIQKAGAGIGAAYDSETLSLLCSEASIPGSTLATHEINNNFTGVTERHAYRRLYDDRASFTFYVDHDYESLTFFEIWMQYIANEQISSSPGLVAPNYFYRTNFPDGTGDGIRAGQGYRSPAIYLNKFEKDYSGRYLQYRFLNAYPIAINSIPVSYENSQLLKCTVSFTFTRYLMEYEKFESLASENPDPNNIPPEARDTLGGGSELERIRGAAALASIGRSVNANRILNEARSSQARDIVDQSFNRVLYGNPNGPNE